MRIVIVAPGPIHSTYDIYRYYLDAMKQNENIDVHGFDFHNHLTYHKYAVDAMFAHRSHEFRLQAYIANSTRSLLYETIFFKPDFIFVVSGTLVPHQVYQELATLRHETNLHYGLALYLTECPYVDDLQEQMVRYADILFVNDKYSVDKFDPDRAHYVDYLPHSYNPEVHYPGNMNGHIYEAEHSSDVLFGGTGFSERVEMMANIDWSGINLKLIGDPDAWLYGSGKDKLDQYIVPIKYINNWELANYYRGTKIALNIHRTRSNLEGDGKEINNYTDAYSVGPRLYEAAACGSFILTDYRKEAEDIFGDTIEFFETPEQMEQKIRYWTDPEHEQERLNKAQAARQKVESYTFSNRLQNIILPEFENIMSLERG